MIKQCVVCGGDFDACGPQKTCPGECRRTRKKETNIAWSLSNPEKRRAHNKASYDRHRSIRRTEKRLYWHANRDQMLENKRIHYSENAERLALEKRQRRLANLEHHRSLDRQRRTKMIAALQIIIQLQNQEMPS